MIRGENVMKGYWKNEKSTSEALRDGWLHTGDMGFIDNDRFLYVLGRFKSLLISDDGEKYSPEGIEETVTEGSPYIDQMMLYNNQNKYTSVLLVPNPDALKNWAGVNNINLAAPGGPESVLKEIGSVIDQYRQGGIYDQLFPSRWLPSAIAIIDEPFSGENKMINSLGKLVRGKVVERYMETIDYMYTPEGKNIVNQRNLVAIKKILQ